MALSNMMEHYVKIKEKYSDCIVFYRLGDFYEMFFDDAVVASKELELTLTSRNSGDGEKAPMCGIPYHSSESYIVKLTQKGYKVAICEQLTEAKKGEMVLRDVIRVITSGTVMENDALSPGKNNYIASIFTNKNNLGLSYADITTGEMFAINFYGENCFSKLGDYLSAILPSEIICNEETKLNIDKIVGFNESNISKFSQFYDWAYTSYNSENALNKQFGLSYKAMFENNLNQPIFNACGALIEYITSTQKRNITSIRQIKIISNDDYLKLDSVAIKNLELIENLSTKSIKGSLLDAISYVKTPMGSRGLRKIITSPLQDKLLINERLDAVEELFNNFIMLDKTQKALSGIGDIERIGGKISYGTVSARDFLNLSTSLKNVQKVKDILIESKSELLKNSSKNLFDIKEIYELIDRAIDEQAPAVMSQGDFIKSGYNAELDEYKSLRDNSLDIITKLENIEKEETGIKSLKIRYNKVFGYFIEVNKSQTQLVPLRYHRKQTVANNERYITEELKEIENKVETASEQAYKLEQMIFESIKNYILECLPKLLACAKIIGQVDIICSNAFLSKNQGYIRPIIKDFGENIEILGGRHPVVEKLNKNEKYIPNDLTLNQSEKIMIITGPNMAGKSTYMRSMALITILAHTGCFVPADRAEIPLVDRIFTRVGASDDLVSGRSTFMVEMSEVSVILHNATQNSLVILDEIGRGTSTFDGLSIAWSVVEYLSGKIGCKTLFATHYHELTSLEGKLKYVVNYMVTVKQLNDSVIFLRKILRGGTNKSFGVEVAKMSGIPRVVISRANEILALLENQNSIKMPEIENPTKENIINREIAIKEQEAIKKLKNVDLDTLSPILALELLYDIKKELK